MSRALASAAAASLRNCIRRMLGTPTRSVPDYRDVVGHPSGSAGRAGQRGQPQAQRAQGEVLAHVELERVANALAALRRFAQPARVAAAGTLGQGWRSVARQHSLGRLLGEADEVAEG